MRFLIDELKRSRTLMVGSAYLLAGAPLLIMAEIGLSALAAPQWLFRLIMSIVFIAFPFVLTLTWALSAGPPEGVRPRPAPWEMKG